MECDSAELMKPDVDEGTKRCRCRICDLWYKDSDSFISHRHRKHGTVRVRYDFTSVLWKLKCCSLLTNYICLFDLAY